MLGRFAEIFAKEIPALIEALMKAVPLKALFAKIAIIATLVAEFISTDFFTRVAQLLATRLAEKFATKPEQIETTQKLVDQIGREIAFDRGALLLSGGLCLLMTIMCLVAPLLYRFASRRRLRIFVSFNRIRNDAAEQLHAFLERKGFAVSRLPFDDKAEHQALLRKIVELLKKSELVVCIPGPSDSFVEHEILAATTIGHPVVLLVSGDDGTIPNTADKRYPVFQIEALADNGFHPLEIFLSFIGGDLQSMLEICKRSLRQAKALSWAIVMTFLLVTLTLWILSAFLVYSKAAALQPEATDRLPMMLAIGVHALIFGGLCIVPATICAFISTRILLSLYRQLRAQWLAELKVEVAAFSRDDWADLMHDVSSGPAIYDAMLQLAPLAHHERAASTA